MLLGWAGSASEPRDFRLGLLELTAVWLLLGAAAATSVAAFTLEAALPAALLPRILGRAPFRVPPPL